MADRTPPESALLGLPSFEHMQSVLRDRTGQEIRDWVSNEVRALQLHLSNINALHNLTLSLNILPEEILIEIFRHAAMTPGGMAWLAKNMGVCRYWRDLIANTPLLWSNIEMTSKVQLVELCLVRSRDANIRVDRLGHRVDGTSDFQTAVSLLASHYPRISHMKFRPKGPSEWHNLRSLVEASLPGLLSMTIAARSNVSLQLTYSHLPNLRNLSLSDVALEWTNWPLPHLTSLELDNVMHIRFGDQEPLHLTSLLDVLEACKSLETFRYEQRRDITSVEPQLATVDERVVSLPCLRRFHLTTITPGEIPDILAHVSLLRDTHLSFNLRKFVMYSLPGLRASMLGAVLPSDSTYIPSLTSIRHVTLWLEDAVLHIWADEENMFWLADPLDRDEGRLSDSEFPSLSMSYHIREQRDAENALCHVMHELDTFFPSSVESLIINGAMHDIDTETWNRLFAAFPHIERLELISSMGDIKTLLPALKPTASVVPCPRMRELYLYFQVRKDGSDQRDLRAVLQERNEACCRLKFLSVGLISAANDTTDAQELQVASGLPLDLKEIERELRSVVDSVEVTQKAPRQQ